MNRDNKRRKYEKGYYKTNCSDESFTCKMCDRLVIPFGAGTEHRNHCPYCLCSQHLDNEPVKSYKTPNQYNNTEHNDVDMDTELAF